MLPSGIMFDISACHVKAKRLLKTNWLKHNIILLLASKGRIKDERISVTFDCKVGYSVSWKMIMKYAFSPCAVGECDTAE